MRLVTIIISILIAIFLSAEVLEPNYMQLPLAATDGLLSAKINPSAFAFKNAAGVGFIYYYDEDQKIVDDKYSFIINLGNLGYNLERENKLNIHSMNLATGITKNLYLGTTYRWKEGNFSSGDIIESLLYRPFDFLSLGAVYNRVWEPNYNIRLGAALRPVYLQGNFWDRLTMTADIVYEDNQFVTDWQKPVFGIQTEFIDGISIGGNYSLESETFGLNFSLSMDKLQIGNYSVMEPDDKIVGGSNYIQLSARKFRSVLNFDKKNRFYEFDLKGEILEKRKGCEIGPFYFITDKNPVLSDLLHQIKELKDDDTIKGLVFKNAHFKSSLAQIQELKSALDDFRKEGKKILFYYDNISNRNYVFASAVADEIYLNPLGDVDLKGISISVPYVKNLLDTLGIDIVNFQSHEYKTAGNTLTETEMTPAEKETYEMILDGLYAEITTMIAEGRSGKLKMPVEEIIDQGPFFIAEEALQLGLVDQLLYEDQIEKLIEEKCNDPQIVTSYKEKKIRHDWSDNKKDRIAIIYAVGYIHMGDSQPGASIGSVTMAKAIRDAREDSSIKGIVIRIDSGGGSALASDIIAREVKLCKSVENEKPVVISMGGVAASGGYYISVYADKIISQPSTITGSIGVIGIIPKLNRFYDKILINWSTVKRGEHADIYSMNKPMTDQEKTKITSAIADSYDKFITVVADGRNMNKDNIHEVARGRVWTGYQAYEHGLVDKLGGLTTAIDEIKDLSNISGEIQLVEFDGRKKRQLSFVFDTSSVKVPNFMLNQELKGIYKLMKRFEQYQNERILMVLPYDLEID